MSNGGRPLKFNDVEKLRDQIDNYFKSCWKTQYTKDGMPVIDHETGENVKYQFKPYTVEGLASYLKTSRQTLVNYGSKERFFDTICEAKERIQAYQAERLFDRDGVNGAKFSLINNYKKDKYEDNKHIDHTSKGNELSLLTPEERQAKIAQYTAAANVTDS